MKKKWMLLLMIGTLLTLVVSSLDFHVGGAKAAAKPVSLFIDGGKVTTDVPPIIENGRTLVPIRVISENMGMNVEWDGAKQEVTIQAQDGRTVVITIGKKTAYANGGVVPLEVPAKIVKGRTLVPIRFVSERFDAKVTWDAKAYAVYVDTGGPRNVQPLTKEDFIAYWGAAEGARQWDDWGFAGSAYLRVTRINPSFKEEMKKQKENPKNDYDRHFARFSIEELLWAYDKGPIPASPYEKEVMDRLAKYKYNVDSWEKVPKYLIQGAGGGWNENWAILLDYHFNEENKLEWFIYRPIGVRYAFKITIKDPIGSYVESAGWAGLDDEKFNGVFGELATPEIMEEIKKTKVVFSFNASTGRITGELDDRFDVPDVIYDAMDYTLKPMEVYRWKNTDYMVKKYNEGGDFAFYVGGFVNQLDDIKQGSKVLPDYFTKRRSFTPGTEWRPWTKDEAAWIYGVTYYTPQSRNKE